MRQPVQERLDHVEHRVLIADERQVIVARQLDERGAGNVLGDVAPFLDRQALVVGAVQHQRRHADRRQDVTDVDLGVHLGQRQHRSGAGAHPQVGAPPVAERRVVGPARRADLDPDRAAPAGADLLEEMLVRCARRPPGIVGRPQAARVGADHHQAERALRIGRGEQAAQRAAFRDAHAAPRAREPTASITARTSSMRCSSVGRSRDPVREAGAALVEQDEPRERRQPASGSARRTARARSSRGARPSPSRTPGRSGRRRAPDRRC